MPHLIEVAFKGNRKEFFLWEGETLPPPRASIVVEADRGEDLGRVHSTGEMAAKRSVRCAHGPGEEAVTRIARRLAVPEDLTRLRDVRDQDDVARRRAMERVKANNLAMKLTDAEWRWDRRKLTIYFTAEKRVDFRTLVRELAAMFRTRIELKQIGVRDEARRLSGIGRCGREYCSAAWLPELRPVNLGVAKDQRLSLNPSQISGACGRLMCCLRYEHDFYVQQRKRFPKEGKTVTTMRGAERVVANDIFRERVTLQGEDGEVRVLALLDLRREMGVERTVEVPLEEEGALPSLEDIPEEVIRLQDTAELPAWLPRPGRAPERAGAGRQPLPVMREEALGDPVPVESAKDVEASDDAAEEDAGDDAATGDPARRRRRRRRGRRGGRRGKPSDGRPGGDSGPPQAGGDA